ncbi:MAG TPA: hypothetical protein VM534_04710 [Thermoanaerobaculia bacterium]|nr:hypothetical protein [Thermoanaerobaculia bacterium]
MSNGKQASRDRTADSGYAQKDDVLYTPWDEQEEDLVERRSDPLRRYPRKNAPDEWVEVEDE